MRTVNKLIPLQEHGLDSSSVLDHGWKLSLVLGLNGLPYCPAQRKSFYAGACLARAFLFFLSLARFYKNFLHSNPFIFFPSRKKNFEN